MNIKTGTPSIHDKDIAWDLALRAWTTEHRLGGWHLVPLTDTTACSATAGHHRARNTWWSWSYSYS